MMSKGRKVLPCYWSFGGVALGLLMLTILLSWSEGKLIQVPRYGKRYPGSGSGSGGEISRIVGRSSSGLRSISSRSQKAFYPGSRYGGKRSYWPPDMELANENQNFVTADCFYIPYVGVRCVRAEAYYDSDDSSSSGNNIGIGGDTRTSIIDTAPSSGQTGSEA